MKTALIAGSTGLVGKQLLRILLEDEYYHRIIAISRKPLDFTHPKLENLIADLKTIDSIADKITADDIFCCLGTTMKKAGSTQAFEAVDYDYPLRLAQIGKEKNASQYLLVSALGANKNSAYYYNKVKARIEEAIISLHFRSTHIFRPSLLLGDRTENRPGEDAAKFFYKFLGFLIPKKYKGIEGGKVARAMVHFAKQSKNGAYIHESADLQQY